MRRAVRDVDDAVTEESADASSAAERICTCTRAACTAPGLVLGHEPLGMVDATGAAGYSAVLEGIVGGARG